MTNTEEYLDVNYFASKLEVLAAQHNSRSKLKLTPGFEIITPNILLQSLLDYAVKFPPKKWKALMEEQRFGFKKCQ